MSDCEEGEKPRARARAKMNDRGGGVRRRERREKRGDGDVFLLQYNTLTLQTTLLNPLFCTTTASTYLNLQPLCPDHDRSHLGSLDSAKEKRLSILGRLGTQGRGLTTTHPLLTG